MVEKRILLTGGPGFGKSSIILELERIGNNVHHEVAREIIQNEVENNGDALPWLNISAFSEKVKQGRVLQFINGANKISFYDRGIPDIIGFLMKDKKEISLELNQIAIEYQYFNKVFITPPWEAIFQRDNERKEDFIDAIKVHKCIESIYSQLGYNLIAVPMGSIKSRAEFILKNS
jgi:predicted ATPase